LAGKTPIFQIDISQTVPLANSKINNKSPEHCRFSIWHWQFRVKTPMDVAISASKTGNISGAHGSGKSALCQLPYETMLATL
jgi:hypothetical protein